ncbi:MAG: hypothetical protein Q8P46_14435 [Hyphomicrobiales bacterium]|nr:hypothetical protein [Hyphomicrobiales bacterium]
MTMKPGPDEAAIERAYVEGKATVAEILARFGISKDKLYRLADAGGWPRRIKRMPSAQEMAGARIALVQRLYRRFEGHLKEAEERRAELGLMQPDEVAERDARTMAVLARTLEKVMELDENAARRGEGTSAGQGAAVAMDEADVERIRAELARRIARLARSAASTRDAGGPEGVPTDRSPP